ncbi:hypothetical protein BGZ54_008417 [Gamsiella multidivaricata]|nr:hypothetical protein BGZ54_008417 [Gamsiella multidivaricata]
MSSAVNTLLQYFLIVSVAYLYTRMPWHKKAGGSGGMGSPLSKLQVPGFTDYYTDRKKRAQSTKKKNHDKGLSTADYEKDWIAANNSDDNLRESLRESNRLKERLSHQKQASLDSTTSSTKQHQSKRSSSGSSLSSAKQKAATSGGSSRTHTAILRPQMTLAKNTSSVATDLPIPVEEAARHRQVLSEMFKDVPTSEIDQVIQSVHWDVDEAAALLAQEDYTWQSVRRRRSVPSLEVA